MFRFESLRIWDIAIEYGNEIYDVADGLPQKELFGLGSQLRRVAVSISSNIAEGSGSGTVKDFKNYLDISTKSIMESVSQLLLAEKRRYITSSRRGELYTKAEKLVKMIRSFKNKLK